MQEDGWAGLRDEHGVIQEESLMALRVNLLFDTPETQTNVLVSLTRGRAGRRRQSARRGGASSEPASGLTPRQAARCWLDAYCDRVLLPLFSAEADYGLVLLAHQQNILVEMQQDFPVGLIYRDCGAAHGPKGPTRG